jgi:hypothetical protein
MWRGNKQKVGLSLNHFVFLRIFEDFTKSKKAILVKLTINIKIFFVDLIL